MAVLVTGGTGFIGAEVVRLLLKKGEQKPVVFHLPLDDSKAQQEWGWRPEYDQERIVDDFLRELKLNPQRYLQLQQERRDSL